jgi:hypothetical protein
VSFGDEAGNDSRADLAAADDDNSQSYHSLSQRYRNYTTGIRIIQVK